MDKIYYYYAVAAQDTNWKQVGSFLAPRGTHSNVPHLYDTHGKCKVKYGYLVDKGQAKIVACKIVEECIMEKLNEH
jgi:hypothetical protein